ncbi:hypothetical protein H6G36_26955 [Anabaena minutissima FACHB-250]|nr:hypothetical protein [Anabaena minutissima FACHB-250]
MKRSAWELPNGRFFPLFGLNHFQAYIRQDLIAPIITPYIIQLLTEQEQLKDSPVVLSN